MNKLTRLINLKPTIAFKKIIGYEEVYTIAIKSKEGDLYHPLSYNHNYNYADPIVFCEKDKTYLYMEKIDSVSGKGGIVYGKIEKNNILQMKDIISEKYHMSFPMVFSIEDEVYMIPETSENRSINIYKRKKARTDDWVLYKEFKINHPIVDPTIISIDSKKIKILASELCVNNPLKCIWCNIIIEIDGKEFVLKKISRINDKANYKSRCAGKLIYENGKCLLPIQISDDYNYGLRIELIDYSLFKKNVYKVIKYIDGKNINVLNINSNDIVGIHTYATNGNLDIVDIRYLKFDLMLRIRKLLYVIKEKIYG